MRKNSDLNESEDSIEEIDDEDIDESYKISNEDLRDEKNDRADDLERVSKTKKVSKH